MSNPFADFGLPIIFNIDTVLLEKLYTSSQSLIHPDRYIGKPALEQRLAAEHAIRLTESYRILKDPLLRAKAILHSKEIPVPGEEGVTIPQSPLLMEVLEWRDTIESATSASTLEPLKVQLTQLYNEVCTHFDKTPDNSLVNTYLKLVYTHKTLIELQQKLISFQD